MANRSRPSQQKRHKERARQEKQKMKIERRLEAKNRPSGPRAPGEDPDIAGIIPGPQRRPDDELLGDLELQVEEEVPEI
jgi:ribulose kinase